MRTRRLTLSFAMSIVIFSGGDRCSRTGRRGGCQACGSRPWPPARLLMDSPSAGRVGCPGGRLGLVEQPDKRRYGFTEAAYAWKELRLPSRLIDPPDGLVCPYQPWAEARRKQQEGSYDHPTRPEHIDTQHRCLLGGIRGSPRMCRRSGSFKRKAPWCSSGMNITHTAIIPLDGRPRIAPMCKKLWMNDSRGRWGGEPRWSSKRPT